MTRFKLTIEYDGRPFVGWQAQTNGPSVQATLEAAVAKLAGAPVKLFGAGRTDAGVHAAGQVAHVDVEKPLSADAMRDGTNFHLGDAPIAVLRAEAAAPKFHARFDARARAYEYRIVNRRAPLTYERGLVWRVARPLDAEAMDEAAQALIGEHDFTTFRASECQAKSPVKTLDRLRVSRRGEEIAIAAEARSFLHHQVRSIVGSLARVGEGAWPATRMAKILAARSRAACGPVAPAEGLYLVRVDYSS